MKKITLVVFGFLLSILGFSQTYTTGEVVLIDDSELGLYYSAQIDVTSSLVTLTLNGPDSKYLGLGFGVQSMTNGGDVVIWLHDGERFELTDRTFQGIAIEPTLDANQNWTIVSNTTSAGQRHVVATRALDTGHGDYVFSTSDASIDLVWSFEASSSYILGWHAENRGMTMQSFTLSRQDVNAENNFSIYPNPSRDNLNINLNNLSKDAQVDVYNILGKKVLSKKINNLTTTINISQWNSGVYLVRLIDNETTTTKRFVKQ